MVIKQTAKTCYCDLKFIELNDVHKYFNIPPEQCR